jgi:hypothetical protein
MDNYIEESAKFRMGDWYDKKFKSNEFDWNDIQEKNYISRGGNTRWKFWIECFKNLGITKNPGIILDSQDAFIYDDFVEKKENYGCSLENMFKIPVATHNRQAKCRNSILFPLREPTLVNIKNKQVDSYSFSEKKNEIVWRGKFTGRDKNDKTIFTTKDIKNNLNQFLRFRFVKKWSKKYNIKFTKDYDWNEESHWSNLYNSKPNSKNFHLDVSIYNKKYIENYFKNNINMIGSFMLFWKEMCQYKYILNLDGHDSSTAIINILKSNSLMISPIPKWHIVVNFKLEPWVHYVPLKDDTSDLEEKLKWCNSNQEKCEEIVKNASEYISQFNEKSEQEIEKRIFEKLYENGE